jgi:uncharacterized protein with GYD domain
MLFVLLMRNNSQGAALMLATGAEGAADQATAVEAFGGRTIVHLATAGRYDVVLVAEFPNVESCLAFGLAATANGQAVETLSAVGVDSMRLVREIGDRASNEQWRPIFESLGSTETTSVGDEP